PTFAEQGFPSLVAEVWFALSGPPGIPAEIVGKLNAAVVNAWQQPDTRQRLARDAVDAPPYDAAAFAVFYRAENEKWGRLARDVIGGEKKPQARGAGTKRSPQAAVRDLAKLFAPIEQCRTCRCLLDHLVSNGQQSWGDREAEPLRCDAVDDQLESRGLHDRNIGGLRALEGEAPVVSRLTYGVLDGGAVVSVTAPGTPITPMVGTTRRGP